MSPVCCTKSVCPPILTWPVKNYTANKSLSYKPWEREPSITAWWQLGNLNFSPPQAGVCALAVVVCMSVWVWRHSMCEYAPHLFFPLPRVCRTTSTVLHSHWHVMRALCVFITLCQTTESHWELLAETEAGGMQSNQIKELRCMVAQVSK